MSYKKNTPTKNNYIILSKNCYIYPNINLFEKVNIMKTPTKNFHKKQKFNHINFSKELNLENRLNVLNERFNDKKIDRESLILQIAQISKEEEIKFIKNKTPVKSIKELKKSAKNKKIKNINQKNNFYNKNDNINTATFNCENKIEKKCTESKLYCKKKKNDNINNIKRKTKLLLGVDEKSLKKINNNLIKGKYKIALKSNNKKKYFNINKSYDDIKLNIPKLNKNINLYSKKIIKYKNNESILNDSFHENIFSKTYRKINYDYDYSPKLNKSFDLPFRYKKKIISNHKNTKIIKSKKNEDKLINEDNYDDMKNKINIFRESRIVDLDLFSQGKNSVTFDKKLLSQNKSLNASESFENSFTMDNTKSIRKNFNILINFEELMIIIERLYEIYKALINNKKIASRCFEFLNYFFNSSFKFDIEILILNSELKEANYILNYIIFFILLIYDYSLYDEIKEKNFPIIKNTLLMIIKINIILSEFIINKVNENFINNKWIQKLKSFLNIINNKINYTINNNNNISSEIKKIAQLLNEVIKNLNLILSEYNLNIDENFNNFFQDISQKNLDQFKYFFDIYIKKEQYMSNNFENFVSKSNPYITQNQNSNKFFLILDLEGILLDINSDSNNKEIIKFRPYLFSLLDTVQKYYELILFTSHDIDHIKPLIDIIEYNKKYFSYKFYFKHNIIINNTLVKDLSRIGIDLNKIIIIDNKSENYRLQKENGIQIKTFLGEENENNDMKLFYLKEILVKIAKDGGDLRKGIEKYREDIFEKISSNIYEYKNEK